MTALRIYKKTIDFISNIIYILIIIYALISAPALFGYKPVIVLSGSMEPTFKVGNVIYYHHVPEDELKQADIITFSYGNSEDLITHRINEINDGKYQTKGDANGNPDQQLIEYADIKGKVSKIYIPYVGHFIKYINEHIYIIVIAILILLSEFILDNLKVFKKAN